MKDRKTSKRPVMLNMLNEDKLGKQHKQVLGSMEDTKYTPEFINAIRDYNSKITNLNSRYTEPKMLSQIVVRMFLFEPNVLEGGTIEPVRTTFQVPTATGQMIHKTKESDYPFSLKGVVVNVPEGTYSIKVGDIIQLKESAVQIGVLGDSKRGYVEVVRNSFRPVSNVYREPSSDLTNEDYGYVLINHQDIVAIYGMESNKD